jgi:hypothetical protein
VVTFEEAKALAKKLKDPNPEIQGIDLFGSVARNGVGHDADIALLVEDPLAREWWREQHDAIRVRWPHVLYPQRWIVKKFAPFLYDLTSFKRRNAKSSAAAKLLGIDPLMYKDVEFFLLPVDWRRDTQMEPAAFARITDLLNDRNTAGFYERVARDAIRVA